MFEEYKYNVRLSMKEKKDFLKSQEGITFIEKCRTHAEKYASKGVGKNNIILVHPYFEEIEWKEHQENKYGMWYEPEEVINVEKLIKFSDRSRYNIILMESYMHYAAMSHMLSEKGFIDKVIFTEEFQGTPIDKNDMNTFFGTEKNYIGGSYGQECVLTVINNIRKFAPFFSIRPFNDGILNPDKTMSSRIYQLIFGTKTKRLYKEPVVP